VEVRISEDDTAMSSLQSGDSWRPVLGDRHKVGQGRVSWGLG